MQTDDEAVVRYRKKRKKKQPKKADHKHEYVDCVFDFNPETIRYIIGNKESSIGSYCPTCGKIGDVGPRDGLGGRWKKDFSEDPSFVAPGWTEDAYREFDPETRTLPSFVLNDFFQKYVEIKEERKAQ